MTHTHTPGPWTCEKLGTRADDWGIYQPDTPAKQLPALARVYSPEDAALISAAPDLLAALEHCMCLLHEQPAKERARAAIAKAKGGA